MFFQFIETILNNDACRQKFSYLTFIFYFFYFTVIWRVYRIISTQTYWKRFVGKSVSDKKKAHKNSWREGKIVKTTVGNIMFSLQRSRDHLTSQLFTQFSQRIHANERTRQLFHQTKIIKGRPKNEWEWSGGYVE